MRASDSLCGFFRDPPDLAPLSDPILWQALKEEARLHGVAALLAFKVRGLVERPEKKWCDEILSQNWSVHDRNLGQIRKINETLGSAGVRPIALKGPILACREYAPAFLRKPAGDLDFAVRNDDLDLACQALVREGYAQRLPVAVARRVSHHVLLEHSRRPRVELHFRLGNGVSGTPTDAFFLNAKEFEMPGGAQILVLDPADELMHLILHLVQDRFVTLSLFEEVRRIWKSRTPQVRAEALRKAVDTGFSASIRLADAAFRSRWGEPLLSDPNGIPAPWLHWLVGEGLYLRMESSSRVQINRNALSRLKGRLFDIQLSDSPARAARTAWSAIATSFWQILNR